MSIRNLSPQKMFHQLALEHVPQYRFTEGMDFAKWKAEALPKVKATVGDFPERVPLNPQLLVEWEHDGLLKQRWIIDVSKHISATFIIARPLQIKVGERLPAILCWHGHNDFGKDNVMGNDSSPERAEVIRQANYNYGHQMAKAGFVTFAIDWIGKGDRCDSGRPHYLSHNAGRDWCNLYYLHATMLGMTSISINVAHGMAAVDFALTFPFVDAARLGCMGVSGGGTMTLWSSLLDERIRASEIICYSDLWAYFGMRDLNYCGMQVAPGLYRLVDVPDLQGLLAPRPLLVDVGVYDTCFLVDTAMMCFEKVRTIYDAAGASENLELDKFPGEHGYGGNKSLEFFRKHL